MSNMYAMLEKLPAVDLDSQDFFATDKEMWFEGTGKGSLVANGLLEAGIPVYTSSLAYPDASKTKIGRFEARYKCLAVDNFRAREDYESERLCLLCPHRDLSKPFFPSYADTLFNDLSGTSSADSGYTLAVPAGCPHAARGLSGESAASNGLSRAMSSQLTDSKVLTPKSWKLVRNDAEGKLSLTFQYTENFSKDDGRVATSYYYQSVTCDLSNGHTYISDIRDGNRRAGPKLGRKVDDITYTASPTYLAKVIAHAGEPLKLMVGQLRDMLLSRGYSLHAQEAKKIVNGINAGTESRVPASSFSKYELEQNLLCEIATLNRYPNICSALAPLTYWFLPRNQKRHFANVPRDTKPDGITEALGLPESETLSEVLSRKPALTELAYMLHLAGADDGDELAWICDNEEADKLIANLVESASHGMSNGFNGWDVVTLLLPNALVGRTWAELIDFMADAGDGKSTCYRDSFLDVPAACKFLSIGATLPSASSPRELNGLLREPRLLKAATGKGPVEKSFSSFKKGFSCLKRKWRFSIGEENGLPLSISENRIMVSAHAGEDIPARATISYTGHLDRRGWRPKHAAAYAKAVMSGKKPESSYDGAITMTYELLSLAPYVNGDMACDGSYALLKWAHVNNVPYHPSFYPARYPATHDAWRKWKTNRSKSESRKRTAKAKNR